MKKRVNDLDCQMMLKQHATSQPIKILDICQYSTNDYLHGGAIRVFEMNKALSETIEIRQFSFTPNITQRKSVIIKKNYCECVQNKLQYTAAVIALKIMGIHSYDFIIQSAFGLVKKSRALKKNISECDIVQVEHPWLFSWINKCARKNSKKIVLSTQNVEYDLHKSMFKNNILKKIILRKILLIEGQALQQADLVISVSDEDKRRFINLYKIPADKIAVAQNGCAVEYESKPTGQNLTESSFSNSERELFKGKKIILFSGSRHPPNQEAANIIQSKIAPSFSKDKTILFVMAGSVGKRGWVDNVYFTGKVSDIKPYFGIADLAINPMLNGSGSNIKMMQYIANGLPVITTKKGARGLGQDLKKGLIILDIEDFSGRITTLIKSKKLLDRLAKHNKEAANRYEWGIIAIELIRQYKKLL